MGENSKLSLLRLFPEPDGVALDQADIQQFILYRTPLARVGESINKLQYESSSVIEVKYYDGMDYIDVVLELNNVIVWKK